MSNSSYDPDISEANREALKEAITTLPKRSLEHYRHKEWAKRIIVRAPDEVISTHTLEEIITAQLAGTKTEFILVSGHKVDVLGDIHDFNNDEDDSYLIETEPGARSLAVQVTETTQTIEANIQSVQVYQDAYGRKAPDPDNWVATVFSPYYVEYNYNAGGESGRTYYTIKNENGKITWARN